MYEYFNWKTKKENCIVETLIEILNLFQEQYAKSCTIGPMFCAVMKEILKLEGKGKNIAVVFI